MGSAFPSDCQHIVEAEEPQILLCHVVKYRAMSVTCSIPLQHELIQKVQLLPFFVRTFIIYNNTQFTVYRDFLKRFHTVSDNFKGTF